MFLIFIIHHFTLFVIIVTSLGGLGNGSNFSTFLKDVLMLKYYMYQFQTSFRDALMEYNIKFSVAHSNHTNTLQTQREAKQRYSSMCIYLIVSALN